MLQFVAHLLMDSVRPQDIAARIGGEEFVLMLTNTSSEAAYRGGTHPPEAEQL